MKKYPWLNKKTWFGAIIFLILFGYTPETICLKTSELRFHSILTNGIQVSDVEKYLTRDGIQYWHPNKDGCDGPSYRGIDHCGLSFYYRWPTSIVSRGVLFDLYFDKDNQLKLYHATFDERWIDFWP